MFSKACEYGIRAAIFIASESMAGRRVGLREISDSVDSPEAFTSKILQQLVRADLIQSIKGPHGGFEMTEGQLERVMLADVVHAIDSDLIYEGCWLGLPVCTPEHPCPMQGPFSAIRQQLRTALEGHSIAGLASSLANNETVIR